MKGLWNETCDVQPEGSMRGKATRTGKAHAGETEIEGPISADMGTHETRTGHKSTRSKGTGRSSDGAEQESAEGETTRGGERDTREKKDEKRLEAQGTHSRER